MARSIKLTLIVISALLLSFCFAEAKKPLVDPFPLRFPLVEAGRLGIEGHVVGQPRARDGIVYFTTREGDLTAVVVPARSILWRIPFGRPISAGAAELGDGKITVRDDAGVVHIFDLKGRLLGKEISDGSAVRAIGDRDGRRYRVKADGGLEALDGAGRQLWKFAAEGTISAEPAVRDGRVYIGTADRDFYCLNASTGKTIWSRRLQGVALHPAVVSGGTVAIAASNSVVYRLSAKGGSILSWEAIPSRIVYEPAPAGSVALLTWAGPTLIALDLRSGKRAGQYEASGPLGAGAVWAPPFIVLFVEDAESGRQRIVFLRSR
jgi:outer membrane protein assembly factor BamB